MNGLLKIIFIVLTDDKITGALSKICKLEKSIKSKSQAFPIFVHTVCTTETFRVVAALNKTGLSGTES